MHEVSLFICIAMNSPCIVCIVEYIRGELRCPITCRYLVILSEAPALSVALAKATSLITLTLIDTRTVLKIENHKGNPKMEILFPLIRELQIDPNMIFYPELQHNREYLSRFQHFLSQCSEEEIRMLIPICEVVLSVLRDNKSIHITGE